MSNNNQNMPFTETFLLTAMGLMGSAVCYMLVFVLKSRCTSISCCCIKCVRQPLTGNDLTNITLSPPPHPPPSTNSPV